MFLRALVVAAVAVGGIAAAPPAQAEDRRPCVSLREFRGMDLKATRAVIEKRWDVVGLGRVLTEQRTDYSYPVVYRACGYSLTEVEIDVVYHTDNDWAILALRLSNSSGATLHGMP